MRVALCQTNGTIGDFEGNFRNIVQFSRKAKSMGAQFAIFPELVLTGYPPLDLMNRGDFISASQRWLFALEKALKADSEMPEFVVLGTILANEDSMPGRALRNTAILFRRGKRILTQHKQLLPTYDVFDESRYFEPGTEARIVSVKDGTRLWRVGLSICEDAWYDDFVDGRQIYPRDPAALLGTTDFVINISASPFEQGKLKRRMERVQAFSTRCGAPVLYVNSVGGFDELLFDGASFVCWPGDRLELLAPSFQEGIASFDLDLGCSKPAAFISIDRNTGEFTPACSIANTVADTPAEEWFEALTLGIRDYFRKTGFSRAILGLSGGIDSAVVACLAASALGPENVVTVAMPGPFSSDHSLRDAADLAARVGLQHHVLPISDQYRSILGSMAGLIGESSFGLTEENLQARLRGVSLMALSNKWGALVLSTGNKSELAVGYCTTYGDMVGALAPIGDLFKTQVYQLATYLNFRFGWIPESTITKPPSAELAPDQTDEESLGSYKDLDRFLRLYLEEGHIDHDWNKLGFSREYVSKIRRLILISEFKRRQAAPILKVSRKAFGIGRRVNIARKF